MKLKFDASSLILCQKLDLVPVIQKLYGTIYITNEVFKEAIDNVPLKYHSISEGLREYFTKEWIKKIEARGVLLSSLGKGESETIAEVQFEQLKNEDVILITDDKQAKRHAIDLNLKTLSVDFLLVEACVRDLISEETFEQKIIQFDKFHKLSLIRITGLRQYIRLFNYKR